MKSDGTMELALKQRRYVQYVWLPFHATPFALLVSHEHRILVGLRWVRVRQNSKVVHIQRVSPMTEYSRACRTPTGHIFCLNQNFLWMQKEDKGIPRTTNAWETLSYSCCFPVLAHQLPANDDIKGKEG